MYFVKGAGEALTWGGTLLPRRHNVAEGNHLSISMGNGLRAGVRELSSPATRLGIAQGESVHRGTSLTPTLKPRSPDPESRSPYIQPCSRNTILTDVSLVTWSITSCYLLRFHSVPSRQVVTILGYPRQAWRHPLAIFSSAG
jgi:hypothetical protein